MRKNVTHVAKLAIDGYEKEDDIVLYFIIIYVHATTIRMILLPYSIDMMDCPL